MAMDLTDEDLIKLTRIISQQIEHVTCAVCCKYYIAPETASCGHTLCHTCWSGRQKCAYCAKPVEHTLRHNGPIQNLTENVHTLGDVLEKAFNIKVSEFLMEVDSENDPIKNVRDWLASSQNHFSAPVTSSGPSSHEMALSNHVNISSNQIQIHTNNTKSQSPKKVVHAPNIPQDDWDKIEQMPDTEDIRKEKENVIGPMDIMPFYIDDDNEYTVSNPRRSSRKREFKPDENIKNNENKSLEKHNSKNSSEEFDKKSNKAKQNWINVKRMRKEFSKLHKKNKNKLNVSIEMCKKTNNTTKTSDVLFQAATHYEIVENTPDNLHDKDILKDHDMNLENKNPKTNSLSNSNTNITNAINENQNNPIKNKTQRSAHDQINSKVMNDGTSEMYAEIVQNAINENQNKGIPNDNQGSVDDQNNSKALINATPEENIKIVQSSQNGTAKSHINFQDTVKLPFYKKSSLRPKCIEKKSNDTARPIETTNHNVFIDSNANENDDIEITIKVANTIANIVIKRKKDMKLKINTDREIQTSLDPYDINEKTNSLKNTQAQNIVINFGENHDVQLNQEAIVNPRVDELKKTLVTNKTESDKKHTDSADTATGQFEITESMEKELSKIMDFEDKQTQSKTFTTICKQKSHKDNETQKPVSVDPKVKDIDMFDSESVKESYVQLLENTAHAPSEILLCTAKTKNKTQVTEKRKNTSYENTLPNSKKVKTNHNITKSQQNQLENESMNYDNIMDTVFANIDADIEETQQSQNITKNTYPINDSNKIKRANSTTTKNKVTQNVAATLDAGDSSQIINISNNPKDSENVFSIGVEKENENVNTSPQASTSKEVPTNVLPLRVEDFLTPVMSQEDDSDKSVVEETPQKTSFTKIKQKSNEAHKEGNQSQRIEGTDRLSSKKNSSENGNKNSIINVTDTSDVKSGVNEPAVKVIDKNATETPLTINKFVNHIHHNSTPLAKKSLNFDSQIVDDLTLCPTDDGIAKTTQEREFMIKAFEKTPTVPVVKPQTLRNQALKHKKCVIAGSCLTSVENSNLRKLCARNKWSYVDKYSKELTHLVVGVDEENKAQRSVKYMCALASSIWIISYEWVEKSMQTKDFVDEEPYEALDSTGHPGPARSRTASKKLFQGISFFCLEPFGVLDAVSLKDIIVSAGGRVVEDAKQVRVTDKSAAPALLLAEPENTQEDRFIYLAMQLSIVPVNYEWVLNCLGSYTLASIHELLLCPASLLPKAISKWPQELLARDDE